MSIVTALTLSTPLVKMTIPVMTAKPTDQYIIRGEPSGLGPPEIDVSLGDALSQGKVFRGSQPQDREIVFQLSLNPTYGAAFVSPARLRSDLYSMLAGQFPTRVAVLTNSIDAIDKYLPSEMYTDGYTKRIEINPFAKDPTVQVTIRCPETWFLEKADTSQDVPLPSSFVYNASAPTGFLYTFTLLEACTSLTIQNTGNGETFEYIKNTYGFLANDIITLDSRPGTRKIRLQRPSASLDIDITGYSIITNNIWPSMRPGTNEITVYQTSVSAPLSKTDTSFTYRKHYWGV